MKKRVVTVPLVVSLLWSGQALAETTTTGGFRSSIDQETKGDAVVANISADSTWQELTTTGGGTEHSSTPGTTPTSNTSGDSGTDQTWAQQTVNPIPISTPPTPGQDGRNPSWTVDNGNGGIGTGGADSSGGVGGGSWTDGDWIYDPVEETIPALPGNDGLVRERGKYGWVVDEWGSTSRSWSDGTSGSNESDPIKPEVDADYVKYWRITITPLEGQAVPPINVRSNGASLRASVVFTAPGKYHGVAKAVSKKGRIVETVEFSVYVPSKYVGKPLQVPPAAVIKRAEHFISGGGRIEPGKKERSQPLRTFFIERRIEIDLR